MIKNYKIYNWIASYNGLINIISESLKTSMIKTFWNNDANDVDWGKYEFPERYADEFFDNFNYEEILIGKNSLGLEEYEIYFFKDKSNQECIFFFRGKWDFSYVTKENFELIFKLGRKRVYQQRKFDEIKSKIQEDDEYFEKIRNSFIYQNIDLIKKIIDLRNSSIHHTFSDIYNLDYSLSNEIYYWIENQEKVVELLINFLKKIKKYIADFEEESWNEVDDYVVLEKIIKKIINTFKKIKIKYF